MTLTHKGRRDKGVAGEREVRHILEAAGFDVRGLEGLGDHLAMKKLDDGRTVMFHVEVKRQESLRPDEWHKQATTEAPPGAKPIVPYRRNGQPWRVTILLDDLLALLP
jgi:Holliday junction resolvase